MSTLPSLPKRPADGHKGTFGRVLVVAGSRGMSGAAALVGLGALRSGAGLVYLAVPDVVADVVAAIEPSYLVVPLPSDEGRLGRGARSRLHEIVETVDAVAIGPGLGRSDALDDLVSWAYTSIDRPVVVDADGLNALATMPELLPRAGGPRVLTPHPGEFARLTESTIDAVQSDRRRVAEEFAGSVAQVVVLKGAGSVVTDGTRTAINETGNDGMGTGGSGDVLTGIVAALLARGMPPFDAARLAVHVHGAAGDLAAAETSRTGMIASDLPRCLARVWLEFESTVD